MDTTKAAHAAQDAENALKNYRRALLDSERASVARRDLPAGSSRAKVTTANARWGNAAEDRDRKRERVVLAVRELVANGVIRASEIV
jgi:hypothetical protein